MLINLDIEMKRISVILLFVVVLQSLIGYAQSTGNKDSSELPSISFERASQDLGTIIAGQIISSTYRFTNTGTTPLIINDIQFPTDCKIPKGWKKIPILPGENSEFTLSFDSNGKLKEQKKTISIYSNTMHGIENVYLHAYVVPIDKEFFENKANELLILEERAIENELSLMSQASAQVNIQEAEEARVRIQTNAILREQIRLEKVEDEKAKQRLIDHLDAKKDKRKKNKEKIADSNDNRIADVQAQREKVRRINEQRRLDKQSEIQARLDEKRRLTASIQTKAKERKLAVAKKRLELAEIKAKRLGIETPVKEAEEVAELERELKLGMEQQLRDEIEREERLQLENEAKTIARVAAQKKLDADIQAQRIAQKQEKEQLRKEADALATQKRQQKLAAEKAARIEAERLQKERIIKEVEALAEIEAQKKIEEAQQAKLMAEQLERTRLEKEAERQAKIEAERLEKERLQKEAEALAQLEAKRKLEAYRLAKLEAEKLEKQRLQKEAEALAELEAMRKLETERLAKLEAERLENGRLQKEAEALTQLEAKRKLEAERLAKLEAERLENGRLQKEAENLAKIEMERKLEVERLQKKEAEKLASASTLPKPTTPTTGTKRTNKRPRRVTKVVIDPESNAGKIACFQEEISEYEVRIIDAENKLQRDKKKGRLTPKKIREREATILNFRNKVRNLRALISQLDK